MKGRPTNNEEVEPGQEDAKKEQEKGKIETESRETGRNDLKMVVEGAEPEASDVKVRETSNSKSRRENWGVGRYHAQNNTRQTQLPHTG